MELTEIKNSFIGYKKADVCKYISDLNELHSAEIVHLNEQLSDIGKKNDSVISENAELKQKIEELGAEINRLMSEKDDICSKYDELAKETEELREKSDIISSAILKAEKCAETVIGDANTKAHQMIYDATEKVNDKAKTLDNAKSYISELRANVIRTLRKFDIELAEAETYADIKKSDITNDNSSGDRRSPNDNITKDRFGLFKRA